MNAGQNLPLTETVYYVLLALCKPGHGYAVMQRVEEMSGGKVRLAAGTMYGALDNLLKKKLILALPSPDPRRKVYGLTTLGEKTLAADYRRMRELVALTRRQIGEAFENEEI